MSIQHRLLAISCAILTPILMCHCASTDRGNWTGFDAEGREDAFDKQTDFDNAQTSKLLDLEQADVID